MTTVSYALGRPLPAADRGGDCRARDLVQGRNAYTGHRFAAPTDCRISNGLLRVTVGPIGRVPSIDIEAWTNDTWEAAGSVALTMANPTGGAMTGAVLGRVTPDAVTVRLVAASIGDAWVTLRRGMRMCSIQHGRSTAPIVSGRRGVTWAESFLPPTTQVLTSENGGVTVTEEGVVLLSEDPGGPVPPPGGVSATGRVGDASAVVSGLFRFVAAIDAVTQDAAGFSVTAISSAAMTRFGAGLGSSASLDTMADLHAQLGDASRGRVVLVRVPTPSGPPFVVPSASTLPSETLII